MTREKHVQAVIEDEKRKGEKICIKMIKKLSQRKGSVRNGHVFSLDIKGLINRLFYFPFM